MRGNLLLLLRSLWSAFVSKTDSLLFDFSTFLNNRSCKYVKISLLDSTFIKSKSLSSFLNYYKLQYSIFLRIRIYFLSSYTHWMKKSYNSFWLLIIFAWKLINFLFLIFKRAFSFDNLSSMSVLILFLDVNGSLLIDFCSISKVADFCERSLASKRLFKVGPL